MDPVDGAMIRKAPLRRARWVLACLLPGLLPGVFLTAPAVAVAQAADEGDVVARQVKAAYLYKFASYVEWPGTVFAYRDSPIVIGVAGDEVLRKLLARMVVDKTVDGRPLDVRRVQAGDALDDVHILFVGEADGRDQAEIVRAARGRPVLLVSDSRDVRSFGSMINLVNVEQRLRFEVALGPVGRSGLKLSALMLSAAHQVAREDF